MTKEEMLGEIVFLLRDIKKSVDFQTKLFEEVFLQSDEAKNEARENIQKSVEMLKGVFARHPILSKNPGVLDAVSKAFDAIPLGGKR